MVRSPIAGTALATDSRRYEAPPQALGCPQHIPGTKPPGRLSPRKSRVPGMKLLGRPLSREGGIGSTKPFRGPYSWIILYPGLSTRGCRRIVSPVGTIKTLPDPRIREEKRISSGVVST